MTKTNKFAPRFLAEATGGELVGEPSGDRVLTDSRGEVAGSLFVAISGPNYDGHTFVPEVLSRGASGAVVSRTWGETRPQDADRLLVVEDTLQGLQDLARAHRARVTLPLVAITGSNGKTTTKELLAAALAPLGNVARTRGNFNNHIGLPLTLLELNPEHAAAVVEIGLNHPGELKVLAAIARPRVGVITNVAAAHLEGLGSLAGVARAKAEIAESIDPDGALVLPADSPVLHEVLARFPGKRLTFGLEKNADVHPAKVETRGLDGIRVTLPGGTEIQTRLVGEHSLLNLLAAIAAARFLGVTPSEAARDLAAVSAPPGRLRPSMHGGVTLLDDSYNANPSSLGAALEVLAAADRGGSRWAILGDMLELGEDAAALHDRAGQGAAFLAGLITVGPLAAELGRGAVRAGLEPKRVRSASDGGEAADLLLPDLKPGDVVLIKASRGVHLEEAVRTLAEKLGDGS